METAKNKSFWKAFIKKRLQKDYWVIIVKRRPWLKKLFVFLGSLAIALTVIAIGLFGYMYFYGNLKDSRGQPIDWDKIKNNDFKKTTH